MNQNANLAKNHHACTLIKIILTTTIQTDLSLDDHSLHD